MRPVHRGHAANERRIDLVQLKAKNHSRDESHPCFDASLVATPSISLLLHVAPLRASPAQYGARRGSARGTKSLVPYRGPVPRATVVKFRRHVFVEIRI